VDKIDPIPPRTTIEFDLPAEFVARSFILVAISDERRRQVTAEGYDAAHDDRHTAGEIALMAASYAALAGRHEIAAMHAWPWDDPLPQSLTAAPRRLLIIAGALILAEIERIDRAAAKETTHG